MKLDKHNKIKKEQEQEEEEEQEERQGTLFQNSDDTTRPASRS